MKKVQLNIFLVLFLITPIFLKAQAENYDAEYLKIVKEFTLHEDGSYDFHYRKEIRLLTYFSFQRLFGETFIVYNPEFQKLKINEAYTVMTDGKKVVTPENAFNEVLPGFARDIPAYNNLREMVVTHTATEIGCVITLDYTIQTQKGFLPFFFGMEEIGEIVPVKEMSIIIRVPQNISLKERVMNNSTAAEVVELAGQKTYLWHFGHVAALSHSSSQDPEQKAALMFSIAKDMTWAYFSFVNQPAFKSPASPDINRRVEAATKGLTYDIDKILALQAVVIDEVKYADIPLAYTGYKVRTPAEVWQSANASSLEKAVLLSEMLKAANINACPVATVMNAWYSTDMGNPALFDGFMVQVNPRETGRIYLSVTQKQSQNLIFDIQDKTVIQLNAAIESMRTVKEKPQASILSMDGKIRLEDRETGGQGEEATVGGKLYLEMQGIVNPYFRLKKDSSYVKTVLAGDISAGQSDKFEIEKLAELRSSTELIIAPVPVKTDYQGYIFFDLPRFKTGFDAWNLGQFAGSGDTPVRLDYPLTEDYDYEFSLPDGYELFTPAVDVSIKNDLGELEISIQQSGGTVKIERSWELYKDVISSDQMKEFREMILAWEKVDWRKIVLRKKR